MKHMRLFVWIVLIFALGGCELFDRFTQFTMEYEESTVIPSTVGIDLPFNVQTPDIETNSESKFQVNDTRKDLVEEIVLQTLDLTITSPENGDFSFLESIEIYLSAGDLPEKKIAWKDPVPEDPGKELILETSDEDLKAYIMKDTMGLRLHTVTDELIASDHHIDIFAEFYVDAKILGQ